MPARSTFDDESWLVGLKRPCDSAAPYGRCSSTAQSLDPLLVWHLDVEPSLLRVSAAVREDCLGLSDDPDWAFDTAGELHREWGDLNPEFAADSAFGPEGRQERTLDGSQS